MTSTWNHTDFVAAWRKAKSCAEVARRFGISSQIASSTANRLRARGIKLKLMKPGRKRRALHKR